jgi:hypothetical protein
MGFALQIRASLDFSNQTTQESLANLPVLSEISPHLPDVMELAVRSNGRQANRGEINQMKYSMKYWRDDEDNVSVCTDKIMSAIPTHSISSIVLVLSSLSFNADEPQYQIQTATMWPAVFTFHSSYASACRITCSWKWKLFSLFKFFVENSIRIVKYGGHHLPMPA